MVSTTQFYLLRRYMCSSSLIRVSIKSLLHYRSLSHHVSYLVSHHLNQSSVSCVRTSGDGDDGGDSSSRRNMGSRRSRLCKGSRRSRGSRRSKDSLADHLSRDDLCYRFPLRWLSMLAD